MNNRLTMDRPTGWVVVTNCSNIKRRSGAPLTPALSYRNLEDLCAAWVSKVQKACDLVSVRKTYGGRTFTESLSACDLLGAELYVISAGLGLVHAEDKIPHYNLTVSNGNGSIAPWLSVKNHEPYEWWSLLNRKLNKSYPIFHLAKKNAGLILALPSTYLGLISAELSMLNDEIRGKIIIITSTAGQQMLSSELRARCLPYDERLDGAKEYQGTRNDFPQRALKHLVNEIDFQNNSINTVQKKILNYLKSYEKPIFPDRVKVDDKQIKKLISENWSKYDGKRSNLHRFLRDIALVACEQKRFGNLWNEVKLEIS